MSNPSHRLKLVTPMFMCGADNRTPELRAQSFRGLLRFWLRAMVGAQVGNDIDSLRAVESRVFGNTEGASPVTVDLSEDHRLQIARRRALPHSREEAKTFAPDAFVEDGEFTLAMCPRLGQPGVPEAADLALALLVQLGSAGKRARRGFGSLQYATAIPADGAGIEEEIRKLLTTIQGWVLAHGGYYTWNHEIPAYPILAEPHVKVLVCREPIEGSDYHQAMVDFWHLLRQDRYAKHEQAFGYAEGRRRRASPLWLRIARSQQGYHLVLTAFRSRPEPLGSPGWSVVQAFLDECKSSWRGVFLLGGKVTW